MNKIPMLEKFAAQSLVEHNGELIFSKEKFAELIVRECASVVFEKTGPKSALNVLEHFGVKE